MMKTKTQKTPPLKLHNLQPQVSKKTRKRVGRGIGSGVGKTSGAGHKGQRSRSGHKISVTFEGGQMPFHRRIPKKRGFKAPNKLFYQTVNLFQINAKKIKIVNNETLFAENLISKLNDPVKILGSGKLDFAIMVQVKALSKNAGKKIIAAGGKFELI